MLSADIIVPTFEPDKEWNEKCLASIIRQAMVVEVRVSDYEQPSYFAIYDKINHGFKISHGDYIIVFGSDDIMYDGMIQNMLATARFNDSVAVYCDYELMDEEGNHLKYVNINPRYSFSVNCVSSHYPDVSLFRRDVVEEFGGWDVSKGRYAMWWLWLQIGRKYEKRIHHCPYYGFRYRQHPNQISKKERPEDREAFKQQIREWLGHVPNMVR